jgi:hypothetical protein
MVFTEMCNFLKLIGKLSILEFTFSTCNCNRKFWKWLLILWYDYVNISDRTSYKNM